MIIGLFGGSFDPFHNGHLHVMTEVISRQLVDKLWVIPTFVSPQKSTATFSPTSRLAMCQIVSNSHPDWHVSSVEIDQGKPVFSLDTIQHFQGQFPDASIKLIMGSDQFYNLPTWHRYLDILDRVSLIVVYREIENKRPNAVANHPKIDGAEFVQALPVACESSTLRTQGHYKSSVPAPVYGYLKTHHLI